jgi:hypothetical protein
MSMEHKAFAFGYSEFQEELQETLNAALSTGATDPLVAFIRSRFHELRDPYEGEPLTEDWESLIEDRDAHQYGDFAITKYYDPRENLGLGRAWESVQTLLLNKLGVDSPLLGKPLGPASNFFDPGRIGSYFQSESDVRSNLLAIEKISDPEIEGVLRMLRRAESVGRGLYVTF